MIKGDLERMIWSMSRDPQLTSRLFPTVPDTSNSGSALRLDKHLHVCKFEVLFFGFGGIVLTVSAQFI